MTRVDPLVQELMDKDAPFAPLCSGGPYDLSADFAPTAAELALMLQVRDMPTYSIEATPEREQLYGRLLRHSVLRVDTGPTRAFVPYRNFQAAMWADGRAS